MAGAHASFRVAIHALAALWIAGPCYVAKAQRLDPPGLMFEGVAKTGSDTRPVRFRFFCSSNDGPNLTGVLAVDLEIPNYEQLRAVFDFDPFEGPDAHAGALTAVRVNGARTTASDRFSVSGSVQEDGAAELFMLELSAS